MNVMSAIRNFPGGATLGTLIDHIADEEGKKPTRQEVVGQIGTLVREKRVIRIARPGGALFIANEDMAA